MFLPRSRWKPPDHSDGRTVWPLCLFPGHTKPRVEDLHCGYWTWMWSSSSGGIDCHHGMLCLGAYLQDCWESGWWNTVSWRAADWIWLCSLSSGLEQWGNTANLWKPLHTVWIGYLQNRMGLLLYWWRSCSCNVNLHMAVMFLWEEAKAISILTTYGVHYYRSMEEYDSILWTEWWNLPPKQLPSGTLSLLPLCKQDLCFTNCLQWKRQCLVSTAGRTCPEGEHLLQEILPCYSEDADIGLLFEQANSFHWSIAFRF